MILPLFTNYKALPDEPLMERVRQAADERAYNELYRRYARLLQGFFFRRIGGDNEQAADLMQDAFMRVWSSRDKYSAEQPFRVWLLTIAYNLCKNVYRKNEHEHAYIESLPKEEPATEDNTPLHLDSAAFDRALSQELSRLSEAQQILFELRFTQELSVPEIATIMDIPEGTVKSRLHTLTQYLRLKLKDYE